MKREILVFLVGQVLKVIVVLMDQLVHLEKQAKEVTEDLLVQQVLFLVQEEKKECQYVDYNENIATSVNLTIGCRAWTVWTEFLVAMD